jgi:hypothetical protein
VLWMLDVGCASLARVLFLVVRQMLLAKNVVDVGLSTNNLEPMLRFCQQDAGLRFNQILPVRRGQKQYRYDADGSVIKLNHHLDPLPEAAPSGYRDHQIERLMRLQGLRARPRRWRLPKDSGDRQLETVPANLLDRQFAAERPNQKWIADFTYLWTAEGWLYVAAVIDLFSRRVVGWSMSAAMTAQLGPDRGCGQRRVATCRHCSADVELRECGAWTVSLSASRSSAVGQKTELPRLQTVSGARLLAVPDHDRWK